MTYLKPAFIALGASLLWGCATVQESAGIAQEPRASEQPAASTETAEALVLQPLPTKDFPIETFYSLLVAELAGNRGRYDIELGNYIQEAHRTRDPMVTAHATRIARYLDANQATLETAKLWVELEPDNAEALYILATELAHDGRLLDAFKYSERLLDLGSTPIFQSIAARAGQATDTQRESLLGNFDRLLSSHPRDLQLLVGKGLLLEQHDQPEEALAEVEKALRVREDDASAVILQSQLLYRLGRSEEALQGLLTVLDQNPSNRRLRLQYARLLADVDLEKAREQFEILVDQSPSDGDLLLSLALVYGQLGDGAHARASFQRLLEMGEQTDAAHYYLGRLAGESGDEATALGHFQQVQQGTNFLPAVGQTLDILIDRGDIEEAQAQMRSIRSRFGSDTEQFYLLEAQTLARYQHLDAAEAVLTEGLTLHPSDTELLYARAMINEQRDRIRLAEDDLRTIIRYQPNNAMALNALGYTLADRTDRYEEAYNLIQQALNIEPNDPSIIDSMGWINYRLGNYKEAVLRLREAMKAFPDPEIAAHLGEVLWVMGEMDEARAIWTQGLELSPDNDIIPEVMRRLEANL